MKAQSGGSARILVVDDEHDICSLLEEILEEEGYQVDTAETGEMAREKWRSKPADLVLLDIWMPDIDGISLLKEWNEEGNPIRPVIMMSGHGTVETAVEATRLGAYDYIEKPLSLARLLVTVERALDARNVQRDSVALRKQTLGLIEPIGKSTAMNRLRERARRVAQHDTPVLLTGEPGGGKRTFAKYMHSLGPRRNGPFVEAGMGAFLADDGAAELYGEEAGDKTRVGLLDRSLGGTLFLEDVGDMDLPSQARLLSALETGRYHRVGGVESVDADVRLMAATHYDLDEQVREDRFRSDLYYHLNVVPFHVPALREHREDVPDLLNHYVDYFSNTERLPYRAFTVAAQNRLRNYPWPGNVRELKNLVQRLLIVGNGDTIDIDEVEEALAGSRPPHPAAAPVAYELPLREAREQFERAYFEHLLRVHGGSINTVARHAGIERTHLYRKLRGLGIHPRAGTTEKD